MDNLLGGLDERLRISITDSPMMWIVQTAMDKAHRKLKSKTGVISRLHEISKFYELAIMQLEGCVKLMQAETGVGEEDTSALENGHERVLADLKEIRDRLQGRLKESELAILAKDRELMDRFENELKLREALEVKENELGSLHADLAIKRSKSDGMAELILSKHDLDQQVRNIKQQLDLGLNINNRLTIDSGNSSSDIDNMKIDQMGSDINLLKETLDHAFGKIHKAILMSDIEPQEQQWMWNIEKEIAGIVTKGFTEDLKGYFGNLSELMEVVELLHEELEHFGDGNVIVGSKLLERDKRSLSEGGKRRDGLTGDEDGSHFVAKLIKNHELIIRRKSEELNWLKKEEIVREKECLNVKKEKDEDLVSLKTRIQQVMVKLDNVIRFNARANRKPKSDAEDRETFGTESFDDVWKKINKDLASRVVKEELQDEMGTLRREKDDSVLQSMMTEEIHATMFGGFTSEFYSIEKSRYDDCYHKDMANKIEAETRAKNYYTLCNEAVNDCNFECDVKDEIFRIVFDEIISDIVRSANHRIRKLKEIDVFDGALEIAEYAVRENVSTILFKEIMLEWKMEVDACKIDSTIQEEEISRSVFYDGFRKAFLNSGSEIKEQNGRFDMAGLEKETSNNGENEYATFTCMSKMVSSKLGSGLVNQINNKETVCDMVVTEDIAKDGKPALCREADKQKIQFDNVLAPILEFSQTFVHFELQAHEKLRSNFLRYFFIFC